MLIKQLSMFSSCCTNTIIISTLSTGSIQRLLPNASQGVLNVTRESLSGIPQSPSQHLPLTEPFSIPENSLWHPVLLHLPCSILPIPRFEHEGDHQNYLILRLLHHKRRHKFCPDDFQNNLFHHLPPPPHTHLQINIENLWPVSTPLSSFAN